MLDLKKIKSLENIYHFNLISDVLFKDDKCISFLIDVHKRPLIAHVVAGNPKTIGMPKKDAYTTDELLSYIEPNNLLAEVEGKYNFIETIRSKFNHFEDELFLFVPIKSAPEPIWLYLGFKKVNLNGNVFVLGQVLRVYNHTPLEILHYQKTYQDPLTKLFTRETLKMHMDYITNLDNAYIMYLDIDGFKQINDLYGHQSGDQFLIDLANFLILNWEHNVIYYRLGGDEFFVYCYNHDRNQVEQRAKKLIFEIENMNAMTKALNISISIGIVQISHEHHGYHLLLNLGDQTMYKSKARGPGQYTFYK